MKTTQMMHDQESYELDNIYNDVDDRDPRGSTPSIWYTWKLTEVLNYLRSSGKAISFAATSFFHGRNPMGHL